VLAEEARLEALLDDLLLLATDDEARAAPVRAVPVDLSDLTVEEAGRPRRVPVDVAGVAAVDGRVVVLGVEDQLVRVVSHLLDNAARHAATEVHAGLVPGVGAVDLVIDDDGPGVPAGERERIFERFARLDDGRARDKGGSGLGLAVVRSIATRHGGSVRVEDSPLGGARFVVHLPTS
jgi:signal transduction histidine kinase